MLSPQRFGRGQVTRIAFAIRIAAVALSIAPAAAADLSRFPPAPRFYPPTPLLRVYNWTGCYLGGQLGGAFADNKASGQFVGFGLSDNVDTTAVIAGGQVGCDLQVARNWVIGAQIDGAWTHLNASKTFAGSQGLDAMGSHFDVTGNLLINANVIATATGRIGYAANFDDIAGLFYLKGGAAFINYDNFGFSGQSALTMCTAPNNCGTAGAAFNFNAPSSNRWGWTIGLGTEWVVDGNWSIFGEWDYLNFGTQNVTFTDATFGSTQVGIKQQINELKMGVNYRFGNPLPAQYP
jgi:outer membrane immunogenic protein